MTHPYRQNGNHQALPVADICQPLLLALQQQNRVILTAPPGAGKSTYLPLFLLNSAEFAGKTLLLLEPRRLAAKSIAFFLAQQLKEEVGQTVGYQIRQEQRSSNSTRLLIVTEGILTKKLQQDPELSKFDLLIFDEFHERSLHADLALALSLDAQQLRPGLKILIMSATLNAELLSQQLQAPVLCSEGRSFPVEVNYIAPEGMPIGQQTAKVVAQAASRHKGSILAFLPGQGEINQAARVLEQHALPDSIEVHKLVGSMTLVAQQAAISAAPQGKRKIVLATNLAQTSLTIEGIEVVVDSGLCRRASFNPKNGISSLETVAISQAAAIQRAGRAGRLAAGWCYRIDTAEKWQRRERFDPAEIEISELTSLRQEVAAWGCQVDDLAWLTPPPPAHIQVAEQLLQNLGQLDADGRLTSVGRLAYQLGTEPRLAAMLLHAQLLQQSGVAGSAWLACLLAALLEDSRSLENDIYLQLQHMRQRLPMQWQQAVKFASLLHINVASVLPLELVPLLVLRAYPDRLAKKRGQGYQLANGSGAVLPSDHMLTGQSWLVALGIQQWQQQNRITVAVSVELDAVIADWELQLQWQTITGWDDKVAGFSAVQKLMFGHCQLVSRPATLTLTAEQKQQAWVGYITEQGLQCLPWTESCKMLLSRIAMIAQHQSEQWPRVDDDALVEQLPQWLGPYLTFTKKAQLLQLPLFDALLQRLSYSQQQQLNQYLPTHWQTPAGSRVAINYLSEGGPRLSVRVQEMYGQMVSPEVLQGKVKLTVELLSPGRQPLQLTKDLSSFWQNAWHEVKKEMKGRYPKHYWPDDPAQAIPTTKTKKAMQYLKQ